MNTFYRYLKIWSRIWSDDARRQGPLLFLYPLKGWMSPISLIGKIQSTGKTGSARFCIGVSDLYKISYFDGTEDYEEFRFIKIYSITFYNLKIYSERL